jgi:hypothetical protein
VGEDRACSAEVELQAAGGGPAPAGGAPGSEVQRDQAVSAELCQPLAHGQPEGRPLGHPARGVQKLGLKRTFWTPISFGNAMPVLVWTGIAGDMIVLTY